ncbi:glucans biosynthesis protein [Enhydrobacter aerosaccus]|uniref:Glucans biosynthesis protein n=1 Tax=Enhydrobacter aerosaccus TaxID=225324 RepID=A0A1T4SPZ3_9HYPH|nr:glucan biosynthesis protein [Enhydrobacter aerosaccus]SKA30272.1 glucans biosynthesis protein [Enhydrobacter aerosaccus]
MLPVIRPVPFLVLLLSLVASAARAQENAPPASGFDFGTVQQLAQKLASEPFKEAPPIEGDLKKLDYDHYRALRARPDTAMWRDGKGLFHVEFFPAGFLYDRPVTISVVENGKATPVTIGADQFDFSDTGLKTPPAKIELAGFKVTFPLNRPDKFDEIVAFLGASYFRAIGRDQVYGSSARGLAIDTAVGHPEEFPRFRSFWLVKPADEAQEMTIWALLDSPSAAGAFAFVLKPGLRTVVETQAVMFARNDIQRLGVAPLTSMYFAGKISPPQDDYRPEIHDSDGLFLLTGHGEYIWRPLDNPRELLVSSFADTNPRGFGLIQRERSFEQYQDSAARLEARPSLWVEPIGDWGDGAVDLVEIPSKSETNDNIVAFWTPRWPVKKGNRLEYRYRLSALADEAALSPLGRVVSTRAGAVPYANKQRRLVVEFAGGELASLRPEQPVSPNVSLTGGKLTRTYVEALPARGTWRMFIDFQPDGDKAVDLRAALTLRGRALTETFADVVKP